MRKFRNIVAWQKADELVARIYELTEVFPKHKVAGFTGVSQTGQNVIPELWSKVQ